MRPNIHTCCPALLSCWKLLILTRPLLAPEQPCNDNWDFIVLIQVRNKLQWIKIFIQRMLTETQTIKMKNNVYKIGLIIFYFANLFIMTKGQNDLIFFWPWTISAASSAVRQWGETGSCLSLIYSLLRTGRDPVSGGRGSSISMWSVADSPFTWWPVIVSQSVHWKLSTESEWWWLGCSNLPFVIFLDLWSMLCCKLSCIISKDHA